MTHGRFFIIYDGRACGDQGTDDAAVLFAVGNDRQEAIAAMSDFGQCALYSYVRQQGMLTDERWECDEAGEEGS